MLLLFQQHCSLVNKVKTEFSRSVFQLKASSNITSMETHYVVGRLISNNRIIFFFTSSGILGFRIICWNKL